MPSRLGAWIEPALIAQWARPVRGSGMRMDCDADAALADRSLAETRAALPIAEDGPCEAIFAGLERRRLRISQDRRRRTGPGRRAQPRKLETIAAAWRPERDHADRKTADGLSPRRNKPRNHDEKPSFYNLSIERSSKTSGDQVMLNAFRIIIAGTLLFGCTVLNSTAHAASLSRALPRAEQPAKADPCKGSWPYIVRSCIA